MRTATIPLPARRTAASPPTPSTDGFTIAAVKPLAGLCIASLVLASVSFPPMGVWPAVFICMTPWLAAVGASRHAPRVYLLSFLWGLAFFLLNMRWMYEATGLGYAALSVYQALYFPLAACPIRHVVRRRGWPLGVTFPMIWIGGEMLRAVVISGFPWFFLAHPLHGVLSLIQISDVTGAYGVSFVVAAINGTLADLLFARLQPGGEDHTLLARKPHVRRARIGAIFASTMLLLTLGYGVCRLQQTTITRGPKVAVVQGDFVMAVDGEETPDEEKRKLYVAMLDAAAVEKPDLYVLPETPWIMYLNAEMRDFRPEWRGSFATLRRFAMQRQAHLVTGNASMVQTPHDLLAKERRYNSATVFRPDGGEPQRYDKVHLVYFGETVPFRFGRFRFLYFALNRLMPFSDGGEVEYSLFPGEERFRTFELKRSADNGKTYHFGIPICYEDVMPYVARRFTAGASKEKQAEFLINISNDERFGRGTQQPQHLATCVFRAVENRVGIARAVNTGISAFVDPDGRVHHRVVGDNGKTWPRQCGYAVAEIGVDSRFSWYSRYGDWFGWLCVVAGVLLYVDYWIARARALREG